MFKVYLLTIVFCILNVKTVTIVSVGQVCPVAKAIRHFNLRKEAYPFDWIVAPYDALYSAIQSDFKYFLESSSLSLRLPDRYGVLDYYGFHFVHDFPAITPNDAFAKEIGDGHITGGVLQDNWKDFIPTVQEKYQRRIDRLRALLLSNEKVYLIRYSDITQEQTIQLRNLLRKKIHNLILR